MRLNKLLVDEYVRARKYFKGSTDETIFLDNETAIIVDENDDFAKYKLIRKYKKSNELYSESNVSNSVLSMLVLSLVMAEKKSMLHGNNEFNFINTLLDTEETYENDSEIAKELFDYEGDILSFLLKHSKVVNDSNYDTYEEIINRVLGGQL